ncbi:diaminopimelate epimerase [Nonlabens spongiae]|uniref:Diaminopimelate epimerase n=1 Tax=Nonlabens spongiae TaxID=331648 RepID=A0A1W6MIG6_9FLAO|nr:diaminopimelate epimerase [Nonlabens spongiae]ARN77249.1 diaminopimelate epimerase [Nonlabens spongiae]
MESFTFYKYQGTGNDFVIIDNRQNIFSKKDAKSIKHLCDRRFGIGADGLILLENHGSLDFKMVYYNADGNESSMCGNGGRCISSFAKFLGLVENQTTFEAIDGAHVAKFLDDTIVSLKMSDVKNLSVLDTHIFTDTGSPHHVELTDNVDHVNIKEEGRYIRNNTYGSEGANVNFVQPLGDNKFKVRTYERGVEDETLSCGTGVTAVALAMFHSQQTDKNQVILETQGGALQVSFEKDGVGYNHIWLTGPAVQVFKGTWSW